jgi:PilZ domain
MHRTNPGTQERRKQTRYPHLVGVNYRLLGREDAELAPAEIEEISRSGLALVLDTEVRPGSVLVVTLERASGPFERPILVRVLNVRQEGRCWYVGASFVTPLSEDTLQLLLLA